MGCGIRNSREYQEVWDKYLVILSVVKGYLNDSPRDVKKII